MRKERKIVLCTTFREFDGSENSKIQQLFLESIKKQNYSNYLLVVTIFREKTVESFLKKRFGDRVIIKNNELKEYRYSLSTVLLNGIDVAKYYENSILIWSTCDIVLKPDYFSIINKLYTKNVVGTTHPNILAKNIENYQKGSFAMAPLGQGFDLLFFSTEILRRSEVIRIIKRYYFYEWGWFEHFLIGIALMYSNNMINLVNYSNVIKIENNRVESDESREFFERCSKRNLCPILKCIREIDMPTGIKSLEYCHSKFKILKITPYWMIYIIKPKIHNYLNRIKLFIFQK